MLLDATKRRRWERNGKNQMVKAKRRTQVFICPECSVRKSLPSTERHWCDECMPKTEMHPVRLKHLAASRERLGSN